MTDTGSNRHIYPSSSCEDRWIGKKIWIEYHWDAQKESRTYSKYTEGTIRRKQAPSECRNVKHRYRKVCSHPGRCQEDRHHFDRTSESFDTSILPYSSGCSHYSWYRMIDTCRSPTYIGSTLISWIIDFFHSIRDLYWTSPNLSKIFHLRKRNMSRSERIPSHSILDILSSFMIVFINPLLSDITLFLIADGFCRENRTIVKWDDFLNFPDILIELIDTRTIDEVWVIQWPWAFTRMRIISLTLSTLILSRWMQVKWCHFFELIQDGHPIIRANDGEYIISWENTRSILIPKGNIPKGHYCGYGEKNDFTDEKVFIEYKEDWKCISTIFSSLPYLDRVTPIYLKEPHITWSKKNMSPSSGTMNR